MSCFRFISYSKSLQCKVWYLFKDYAKTKCWIVKCKNWTVNLNYFFSSVLLYLILISYDSSIRIIWSFTEWEKMQHQQALDRTAALPDGPSQNGYWLILTRVMVIMWQAAVISHWKITLALQWSLYHKSIWGLLEALFRLKGPVTPMSQWIKWHSVLLTLWWLQKTNVTFLVCNSGKRGAEKLQ